MAGATVAAAATVAGLSLTAGPAVGEPDVTGSSAAVAGHPPAASQAGAPAVAGTARPAATAPASRAGTRPRATSGKSAGPATAQRTVKPYLIYDSVLPGALPANHVAAVYATGPYAVQESAVRGHGQVLWIDTRGTDPAADVLDIEPGCAPASVAASWTAARLSQYKGTLAVMYTSIAQWSLVKGELAGLPGWMQARIRWWIANPTGYPHLVPGSDATQWYWGNSVDISTATSRLLVLAGLQRPAPLCCPLPVVTLAI